MGTGGWSIPLGSLVYGLMSTLLACPEESTSVLEMYGTEVNTGSRWLFSIIRAFQVSGWSRCFCSLAIRSGLTLTGMWRFWGTWPLRVSKMAL